MEEAWIIAAKRTPIGKFMGSFSRTPVAELGAAAAKARRVKRDTYTADDP